ncbi:MAG: DUF1269 domain-containing protein, partial [Anaerolineae bacterium]|nr:DUF1269 domain-containing protein [Anaerolineae bacterium]
MTEPKEQEQATEQAAPEVAPVEPAVPEAAPVPAAEEKATWGVGFLVMAFNDEKAGDQALDAMKKAKKEKQFYFEEAAVIRQDANGKVHYHETGDMGTRKGAGIGALVGGVLSFLGGPIGLAVGAGLGAAAGALAASKDSGFRNESLNMVGVALKPSTSAVVTITSHDFLKAVQKQVPVEQIRESVANLSAHLGDRLRCRRSRSMMKARRWSAQSSPATRSSPAAQSSRTMRWATRSLRRPRRALRSRPASARPKAR